MIDIPVLCDAEQLPRVRLLMTHMQSLGINLKLVEKADPQAACVLLIPRAKQTRLSVAASDDTTLIILYLDHDPEHIGGDLDFHIPAWPARSSDEDVVRLARALRSWRKAPKDSTSREKSRFDRNNVIAVAVIALTALGLYALTQTSGLDKAPEEQQTIAHAEVGNEPAGTLAVVPDSPQTMPGMESESAAIGSSSHGIQAEGRGEPAAINGAMTASITPIPAWPGLPLYICPTGRTGIHTPRRLRRGEVCEPLFDESEQLFR